MTTNPARKRPTSGTTSTSSSVPVSSTASTAARQAQPLVRVNVGCGATPTPGWTNLDNSLTVRLAHLAPLLARLRLLDARQLEYARVAQETGVRWCDAVKGLPFDSDSVHVVYSSHMLEHLDSTEARAFLCEAWRVLVGGGHLRIAVPDLSKLVQTYVTDGDADAFVARTLMTMQRPRGLLAKARLLLAGPRHHLWMYDAASLSRLLEGAGFVQVSACPRGETTIPDPGHLDLAERAEESVYVEARKPTPAKRTEVSSLW